MQLSKQPFYVIGHNPNSIEEAKEYLDKGVNGLEPDIVYAEGTFYISHQEHLSYTGVPTLQEYLRDLQTLLALNPHYQLALLIWDIKTTNFNPNDFISLVRMNLSEGYADNIIMLLTHSDDYAFVSRYDGRYPNIAIGVDESNETPLHLQDSFTKAGQQRFSYADGITTFLTKPGVFGNIVQAKTCQANHEPQSFGFVYTWVLSMEKSLRRYLNVYIDGIMVDLAGVHTLMQLLMEPDYQRVYKLALPGYNPFTQPQGFRYLLEIKTADRFMGGTDADLLFSITGSKATLKSLPVETKNLSRMERGSITSIVIQGGDIGNIVSLTIEMISGGLASGWLPDWIRLTNRPLGVDLHFHYNDAIPEEWISKGNGVLTKSPSGNAMEGKV